MKTMLRSILLLALASTASAAAPTASDYANLANQINALSASYAAVIAPGSTIPNADLLAASDALAGAATTVRNMQYRTPAFTYEDVENSLLGGSGLQAMYIVLYSPGGPKNPDPGQASHFLAISAAYLAARAIVVVYAAAQTPAPVSATPQAAPEQSYEVEVVPIPNATTPATVVPLARTAIRSNQ